MTEESVTGSKRLENVLGAEHMSTPAYRGPPIQGIMVGGNYRERRPAFGDGTLRNFNGVGGDYGVNKPAYRPRPRIERLRKFNYNK